jgi:hypothetical protein
MKTSEMNVDEIMNDLGRKIKRLQLADDIKNAV